MYILKQKLKNETVYYLCKSFWDSCANKNSSKIVERIGTEEELKSQTDNIEVWLKKYAKERTKQEKKKQISFNININTKKKLSNNSNKKYNAGYFALQSICYKLGIDKICKDIAKQAKYKGDLTKIVLAMIYNQILFTDDSDRFHAYTRHTIEDFQTTDFEIAQAIEVLSDYSEMYQNMLYENASNVVEYDYSLVFNECVNYCYGVNQYSLNDESNINPSMNVAQLELITDANGIPVAYLNNSSANNSKIINEKIWNTFLHEKNDIQVVSFKDSLPSRFAEKTNEAGIDCKSVKNIRISMLKPYLKDWVLESNEWKAYRHNETFDLCRAYKDKYSIATPKKEKDKLNNMIFYKAFCIDKEKKKQIIAGFNFEAQREDMLIRNDRYEQIKQMLDKHIIEKREENPDTFESFVESLRCFLKKNIDDKTFENNYVYDFDSEFFAREAKYDGFYVCLCDTDIKDSAKLMYHRFNSWLVDYVFKNIKQEFSSIPENLPKEKSINAHLLISFSSLMVIKILLKSLKGNFLLKDVRDVMLDFDFVKMPKIGWFPVYSPNDITKVLDDLCDIKTDYEFISQEDMDMIIKATKVNNSFK